MDKTRFLTIFGTFGKLESVRRVLPSIVEETREKDARLIVHDSSIQGRDEKWSYLQELNENNDFFLILSDNMSMAHARNMCLHLGQELYAPDYICMIEDDHGYKPGFIENMIFAMDRYYGELSPNGLRFGMFTGCMEHCVPKTGQLLDGNSYPAEDAPVEWMGGSNSCCRCAPTQHWNNVLKGYDTDEYEISTYQTRTLKFRNYNKGFTCLYLKGGEFMFTDDSSSGRGTTDSSKRKLWDSQFTRSDRRSVYRRE